MPKNGEVSGAMGKRKGQKRSVGIGVYGKRDEFVPARPNILLSSVGEPACRIISLHRLEKGIH